MQAGSELSGGLGGLIVCFGLEEEGGKGKPRSKEADDCDQLWLRNTHSQNACICNAKAQGNS
jgi:hypothetical protein